jgi:hypothetical protein
VDVYLEVGKKKVFAGYVDWPGSERSAKTEDEALERLLDYAPRYAKAVKIFKPAKTLEVVERIKGDMTTDFGAPGTPPKVDERDLTPARLKKLIAILEASWAAFDKAASKHAKAKLSTGPRGGGRSVPKMIEHVMGADRAYLSGLGGTLNKGEDLREKIVETLRKRAKGEELPPTRRKKPLWPPRYLVRRSAWHALDHAWEIEDRATK